MKKANSKIRCPYKRKAKKSFKTFSQGYFFSTPFLFGGPREEKSIFVDMVRRSISHTTTTTTTTTDKKLSGI